MPLLALPDKEGLLMDNDQLSRMQRFFIAVLPRSWAESMRDHSLKWHVRCACGFERSVWALGGIRWKTKGDSRWFMRIRCPQCGQKSWHGVYRSADL